MTSYLVEKNNIVDIYYLPIKITKVLYRKFIKEQLQIRCSGITKLAILRKICYIKKYSRIFQMKYMREPLVNTLDFVIQQKIKNMR